VNIAARACALLLAALCCASGAASATTMELYGFGPRATALGNTSEAISDDYVAVYANPANLALADHIHFGLGTDMVWNRFVVDREKGQDRYPSRLPADNYLAHVGISSPLGGWIKNRAALAVAIHLPMGGPTRLDALDYRTPQVTLYDTLGDRLALVFGLGVRPLQWLSIGASAQLLTTLQGKADVDLSILDHRVTRKQMDVELLTKIFPIFGVTVTPEPNMRFSLVYRAKSEVRYGIPLAAQVEDLGLLHFAIAGVGLFLPDTFALAASYKRGALLGTAGVAWALWSQTPPLAPQVQLSLDDRALVQKNGTPDEILFLNNKPMPLGARDILIPRAGIEWLASEMLVLRGGVQYRPTPLPRADGVATYLDAPATTLTLGAGIRLADPLAVSKQPLQIDAGMGWTVLSQRSVEKLDASDPVGATSLHGGNLHLTLAIHHDF